MSCHQSEKSLYSVLFISSDVRQYKNQSFSLVVWFVSYHVYNFSAIVVTSFMLLFSFYCLFIQTKEKLNPNSSPIDNTCRASSHVGQIASSFLCSAVFHEFQNCLHGINNKKRLLYNIVNVGISAKTDFIYRLLAAGCYFYSLSFL